MNSLVVYDSQYGNTERIAQAIAEALRPFGEARAARIDAAHPVELAGLEMLIVGSPTQGWRPTPTTHAFIERVAVEHIRGLAVACFDTRFHKPRWLTGSAAMTMAKRLQQAGVALAVPPESFFVKESEGPLESGEVDRAAAWARALFATVTVLHPVAS